MIPEFWTTRSEAYLAAILGETVELPEPQSRMELYLAKIAGVDVEVPEPQTRSELFLAAILGESVELPAPRSRVEFYLAKIAGLDVETPEPQTRIDFYLDEWAENGSGWSWETVTGVSPLALASAVAHSIKSLIQHGKCVTSGGDIYCNNGKLTAVDDELPTGYKRVLGFSCNNNAMWKITGFKLRGSDTVRVSFSVTAACNVWGCYQGASDDDNYDLYASTSSGAKYFRYGNGTYLSYFAPADLGQRFDVVYTPTGSTGMPQDSTWEPATFESANDLMLGTTAASSSSAKLKGSLYGDFIVDGRLHLVPCERVSDGVLGYYDLIGETFYGPSTGFAGAVSLGYDHSHETVLAVVGTPEVITLGEQTATAVDLFATDDVADEQDIISGVVTRRVEVTITGGVITITPLATPVIEHVTPQPLSTVEGDNTLSWTAEVSGTVKEVEYAYEAPSYEWKSASGAVVNVSDAIAGEVGALTVGINPVQTGSGDPSPSNVRPISGWSNIDVWVQPTYDTSANPSATVSLGGTYYGGTLDVLTGVLTVDRAIVVYDGSEDESWTHFSISSGELFRTSVADRKRGIVSTQNNQNKCFCNAYKEAPNQGSGRVNGTFSGDILNADFVNDAYSTVDGWRAYLSANNVQFCYELATPQTVQLTPAQVSTLLGTNVIWASGNGEISVTYRAEASE